MIQKKKVELSGRAMIIISITIVIIVSGSAEYIKFINKFDKDTLCPINRDYNHNIVIIDRTDPWRKTGVDKLRSLLQSAHENVRINDRLSIKVIRSDDGKITKAVTLFDLCNPGQESDANPLFQNPTKFRRRYENEFKEPFKLLAASLVKPGIAPNSPILNTVTTAINNLGKGHGNVMLVSDLFENSEQYDFYNKVPEVQELINSTQIRNNRVSIQIMYIERSQYRSKIIKQVRELWAKYFDSLKISFRDVDFMKVK